MVSTERKMLANFPPKSGSKNGSAEHACAPWYVCLFGWRHGYTGKRILYCRIHLMAKTLRIIQYGSLWLIIRHEFSTLALSMCAACGSRIAVSICLKVSWFSFLHLRMFQETQHENFQLANFFPPIFHSGMEQMCRLRFTKYSQYLPESFLIFLFTPADVSRNATWNFLDGKLFPPIFHSGLEQMWCLRFTNYSQYLPESFLIFLFTPVDVSRNATWNFQLANFFPPIFHSGLEHVCCLRFMNYSQYLRKNFLIFRIFQVKKLNFSDSKHYMCS